MRRRLCMSIGLALSSLIGTAVSAETLVWWRFESHAPDSKLQADMGSTAQSFSTSGSEVGMDLLRTFNTRPDRYPPDTSGTFKQPPDLPTHIAGLGNRTCVRFVGKEDFYSTSSKASPRVDSASLAQFTIEGLFQLDVISRQIGDRYQCIVGKDGRPVDQLPFQPLVLVVAGKDDEFMSRDCLSINLIDASGQYRSAASRKPLVGGQWYAFAAVCDGSSLKLYLNRFDGNGYVLEGDSKVERGLIESAGTWTVGRGMFESDPNSWLQGSVDEVRICNEALPLDRFLTHNIKTLPTPAADRAAEIPQPQLCVRNLADPAALWHDGNYYLYGTGDTRGFDVWRSADLKSWTKVSRALEAGTGVWGDSAFWAPAIVRHKGKFYLFYSASGLLPEDGNRRSVRIGVAVADSPAGPFREAVARMPLIGRAVIDPEVFIDSDGKAYLYFVADVSENNGAGAIYVTRLSEDLLSPEGEAVECISPSQPWEGTVWNEAPAVMKANGSYVLMYSGGFWASHDYAVGYATSPSPLGPWDKCDENPLLRRWGGLLGTGHHAVVQKPHAKDWLMFFHAHRNADDAARDTYVATLQSIAPDPAPLRLKPAPLLAP